MSGKIQVTPKSDIHVPEIVICRHYMEGRTYRSSKLLTVCDGSQTRTKKQSHCNIFGQSGEGMID